MTHTITASRDTWIKRRPDQAANLADHEKIRVTEGVAYTVEDYKQVQGGHWEIISNGDRLYIFDVGTHGPDSHWICSWEQDDQDDDAPPARYAIARAQAAQEWAPKPVGRNLRPYDRFDTLITPHFTYGEMCKYDKERRFLDSSQCETAVILCEFLEQARAVFGGLPLRITSGHRPDPVNRRVGGATFSEHLFRAPGMGAVDAYIEGISTKEFEDYCDRHWPHSVGYGSRKGFVHLGIGRGRVRWDY